MTIACKPSDFGPTFSRIESRRLGKLDRAVVRAAEEGARALLQSHLPEVSGELRRSVSVRIGDVGRRSGDRVVAIIEEDTPYASAIEFGTRPFTPPIAPLIEWSMRKFGLDYDAARKTAFAVRAKIQAEGITAQHNTARALPMLKAMLELYLQVESRKSSREVA